MDFTCLFRQYTFNLELKTAYHKINLLVIKCENLSFDVSLKNILGGGNVIINVVMCKKKVLQFIAISKLVRFHCNNNNNNMIGIISLKERLSRMSLCASKRTE
jgi:hypothetical protein